jgi:hypothetical protein
MIPFMEHDLQNALNMKLILCIFKQLSISKNKLFYKREIYCFGKAKEEEHLYREIFGCESGALPFEYPGIPLHYRRLRNSEWNHVCLQKIIYIKDNGMDV